MTSASLALSPRRWFNNLSALVVDNPIIERELKVRVRFARAFWLQGAYLFLLTAIVTAAYQGIVARNPLSNPAELQQRLQGFYWMLLYSLITLVVLIAPALTAGALSFEKERRTLDLLLASPLRPSAILSGKLIASFAFVLLLLILSMPIVTVCVLLGGATLGDVLATYVMIAFDVLHLSAFALYCSACNRSSGTATFWAYLGTALLLAASAPFAASS
ncbi:MAG: ABC transporter permease subunit, partial [Armatimonadetes bacterium]|nr:ABC transporter permease subunit [Armatimonadota bacterium]